MGWVALDAAPFVEKCEAGELSYQKEPCHACAGCPPEKSLETNISQMVFRSSPYLWSQAVAMPSELLESLFHGTLHTAGIQRRLKLGQEGMSACAKVSGSKQGAAGRTKVAPEVLAV